jgi:hypothetical protein
MATNSENRVLIFNGQFNISAVSTLSGTWPNRIFNVSSFSFNDNLDSRSLGDAEVGDIVIDSSRHRFIYQGLMGGPFGVRLLEDPWDDIDISGGPVYTNPQVGVTFIFRQTPNCDLYQHGRTTLGIPEQIVEYLSQKANYQIEERLCGTGPSGVSATDAINILGSNSALAPTEGQTGGIAGDRPIPQEGDEWINPDNGDRWIYQSGQWQLAPCCGPTGSSSSAINILGSSGATGPTEGLTGGITDRPDPVEGDEWIHPVTGDRWIYQDGMWQLAPCCSQGATGSLFVPRYLASSFGSGATGPSPGYAMLRSTTKNGVDVTRALVSGVVEVDVDVPENEDLYHMSALIDMTGATESDARFTFTWHSSHGFNTSMSLNAVAPTITMVSHGNDATPSDTGALGVTRMNPQIYNYQNVGSNSIEILLQEWPERWLLANFSF